MIRAVLEDEADNLTRSIKYKNILRFTLEKKILSTEVDAGAEIAAALFLHSFLLRRVGRSYDEEVFVVVYQSSKRLTSFQTIDEDERPIN